MGTRRPIVVSTCDTGVGTRIQVVGEAGMEIMPAEEDLVAAMEGEDMPAVDLMAGADTTDSVAAT
jgi:hypothetical protein